MKTKALFYSLIALTFVGSAALSSTENTKVADALTVASTNNSSELYQLKNAEDREEGYEAQESIAEAN